MSRYTVMRVRERFVEHVLDDALNHRHAPRARSRTLDGEQEARLIALACSGCPVGQARWTWRMLADRMVELSYVESVSHETVRQVLKKMSAKTLAETMLVHSSSRTCPIRLAHGRCALGLHPPLRCTFSPAVYGCAAGNNSTEKNWKRSLCNPDTRNATMTAMNNEKGARFCLPCEPLVGRRDVQVTERRTSQDWAHFLRDLVAIHSPQAEKIVEGEDNLNTHTPASLYQTRRARRSAPHPGEVRNPFYTFARKPG